MQRLTGHQEVISAELGEIVGVQIAFCRMHLRSSVFEHRQENHAHLSPVISQIIPVLKPPPSALSRCASPVVILLSSILSSR